MAVYKHDPDLIFLQHCENDDLTLLENILINDPKDKKPRLAQELTSCPEYKAYHPDRKKYWRSIAAELQTFGANTLVTKIIRQGQGVQYREVLIDICKKHKVNFNKNSSTEKIEMNLLLKIMERTLDEMAQEERNQIASDLEIKVVNPTTQVLMMTMQASINLSGFAAYKLATTTMYTVLKAFGFVAPMPTYLLLTQAMKVFSGPIGWTLSLGWLASDIASPAYRVTLPACIVVAYMRQKYQQAQLSDEDGKEDKGDNENQENKDADNKSPEDKSHDKPQDGPVGTDAPNL